MSESKEELSVNLIAWSRYIVYKLSAECADCEVSFKNYFLFNFIKVLEYILIYIIIHVD